MLEIGESKARGEITVKLSLEGGGGGGAVTFVVS